MHQPIIGADTGDFRLPVKESLQQAARLHFHVIELPTVEGDLAPNHLSLSGRRHLSRLVDGYGLRTASLLADMPHLHITDTRTVDQRVQRTLEIIQLAHDLKVPVVTAAFGALTHPETAEPSPVAMEAMGHIGEVADTCGVYFAIRPSYESGERLLNLLDTLRCPSIKMGIDPASMVMAGVNPLALFERFVADISLLHIRDGTSGLRDVAMGETRPGHETPLGQGDVDFVGILQLLDEAEYQGPYIVRRTESSCPADDILLARETFKRMLPHR